MFQLLQHTGSKFRFLMGKLIKPVQTQEDINRNDYTMPFVCNHGTIITGCKITTHFFKHFLTYRETIIDQLYFQTAESSFMYLIDLSCI